MHSNVPDYDLFSGVWGNSTHKTRIHFVLIISLDDNKCFDFDEPRNQAMPIGIIFQSNHTVM